MIRFHSIRILLPLLIALFFGFLSAQEEGSGIACGKKVATTLKSPGKQQVKKKKIDKKDEEVVRPRGADSIEWAHRLVFAGYDKQLASSQESFFISNRSEREIKQLKIRITYLDLKGRMLHQREEVLSVEIPPQETRKVDIKSFDVQHSFYHILSNKPTRRATPFDTRIEILSLTLKK
ncbi:MAG: hypothetical protein HDS43_02530 [Bacteroides sp.]|nr:hypothetical protein [Bacteroides sp.]